MRPETNQYGALPNHVQCFHPHRWIEQASTYPEEHPGIDGERETKTETYIQQLSWIGTLGYGCGSGTLSLGIGDLGAGKGKEEKEEGTSEFASHCDEVISECIRACGRYQRTP